jgi:hypothetical protein
MTVADAFARCGKEKTPATVILSAVVRLPLVIAQAAYLGQMTVIIYIES